jgi:succinate dehydrogenase hydrophobic anchor subunit
MIFSESVKKEVRTQMSVFLLIIVSALFLLFLLFVAVILLSRKKQHRRDSKTESHRKIGFSP